MENDVVFTTDLVEEGMPLIIFKEEKYTNSEIVVDGGSAEIDGSLFCGLEVAPCKTWALAIARLMGQRKEGVQRVLQ